MASMVVAQTILQQLGGNRFRVMTGASSFAGDDKSLSFKLPGRPGFVKNGIRAVTITLSPDDTYSVAFYAWRRNRGTVAADFKVMAQHDGIYCDQLQTLFTRETGLATRL